MSKKSIAVACPLRSVCDHHARVFDQQGRLQGHYLGTRNGSPGIPDALSHRLPALGLFTYAVSKVAPKWAEAARVACYPWFDSWVKGQLPDGCGVMSSYGYTVEAFRHARRSGGFTLLDAGNSHFKNYWQIVWEEHQRWNSDVLPFPKSWYERGLESIELTDWVFSPSQYVTNSYLQQGFPAERVLYLPYPVDLQKFNHHLETPVPDGPIRVICTGGISIRKGFPYLLEAMRIIRKRHDAVLLLMEGVHPSMEAVMAQYQDVPIEWAPMLSHDKLGARLKSAHVFALLSVEEGLARTALEAMACGLPVVLTPNTGASDFVVPGRNGEIVPMRDAAATAEAILSCYELYRREGLLANEAVRSELTFDAFTRRLISHMEHIDAQ